MPDYVALKMWETLINDIKKQNEIIEALFFQMGIDATLNN